MNAPTTDPHAATAAALPPQPMMTGADYRESLRRYRPTVFVDGRRVASVADERAFQPGINAIALTYDFAHEPRYAPIMTAVQHTSGQRVNRLTHINTCSADLLNKLEAVRLICQQTGCAQRYLTQDAMNAIGQVAARIDDAHGRPQGQGEATGRYLDYLHRVQREDLTLGIAMTDAKGDRSQRPHQQGNRDSYVHIVDRHAVRCCVIADTFWCHANFYGGKCFLCGQINHRNRVILRVRHV